MPPVLPSLSDGGHRQPATAGVAARPLARISCGTADAGRVGPGLRSGDSVRRRSGKRRSGIDVISDGEWRREGYFQVFYERVDGFAPDLIRGRTRMWPAAVAPLRRHGPMVADGTAFLRRQTARAIRVGLPSAYVILRRFWSPEHSTAVYPTREHFLRAVEKILLQEAEDILAAGADAIQFDDPMLGYFVDPAYRTQRSEHWGTGQFADVDAELRLGIDSVNRLAGPLRSVGQLLYCMSAVATLSGAATRVATSARYGRALCGRKRTVSRPEFGALPEAGSPDVLGRAAGAITIGLRLRGRALGPDRYARSNRRPCSHRPRHVGRRPVDAQSRLRIRPERHQPDPSRRKVLAAQARSEAPFIATFIDAQRGQVFGAIFRRNGADLGLCRTKPWPAPPISSGK